MPEVRTAQSELEILAETGRAMLEAELDEDQVCELVYRLASRVVSTANFQLGLFDGDRYQIQVWVKDGIRLPPTTYLIPAGQGILGWMRTSRRALLVHDFQAELEQLPARPSYNSEHPPVSAIFLPLPLADTIIGAMSIQSYERSAFNEEDLRLLTILANQSAAALNNARLYARGQRRLNDLLAVSEVGSRINSILNLDELLTQVVQLISSRFGYYHVQIFVIEPGSDRALFKASSGEGLNAKWQAEGRFQRVGTEGIIGWVAQSGEPLLANDVALEPRYIADDPRLLPDTRAELAVPLRIEDAVVGVLDVQSNEASAFGQDDVFVLSTLAGQVAVAIASARAYEAQQEEAWMTTVMLQVTEATSQAEDVGGVLHAAVRVTTMLGGVDSCIIWLWDGELETFQYAAGYGLRRAAQEGDLRVTLRLRAGDWSALDYLHAEKTALVINTEGDDLPESLRAATPGDTVVLLPMLSQGVVFGALGISLTRHHGLTLSERQVAMLGGIAHQVALAIDNSRLTTAYQEEAWVSTVLLQFAETVSRFQPIDATLAEVARLTPLLAGVDRCAVLLQDAEGNFRARTVHAVRADLAGAYEGAIIRPSDLPVFDDARRLGQPLVVDDAEHSALVPEAWRARFASRTILVVPLLLGDMVIGALVADDVDSTHMFSPRRVRILSGIAGQTAVAIENARLQSLQTEQVRLNHELQLGREIQRSLVPQQAPRLPGYEIVFRWRQAGQIGGDFLDFIPIGESNVGLLVADVSDKGIPAALYMMFARTLLRAVAFSGREPAAMLARANDLIVSDSTADLFVTVYYGLLNTFDHTLKYASAGHNLAYYLPASGALQPMITQGIALGIVTPAEIEQKTLNLSSGDLVLFYTDGLTDALNDAVEEFGEERLTAQLLAHRGEPAEAIADAIEGALLAFTGTAAQYDDLTLVLLKRR